jgi:hypothetical protein
MPSPIDKDTRPAAPDRTIVLSYIGLFIGRLTRRTIEYLSALFRDFRNMDRDGLRREARELAYQLNKQLFSQIPGVSAIVGLLVGSWVAATFTSSPLRGLLSSWGVIKGGTHVVSTTTYRSLSVLLPIFAIAVSAYLVQKVLKIYRERQLERYRGYVAGLGAPIRSELSGKVDILNMAKEAGLLSENEYQSKIAGLYQTYSRNSHSPIEEIIIKKLEN